MDANGRVVREKYASNTIGAKGCQITALAMLLRYHGLSSIPNANNDPTYDTRCDDPLYYAGVCKIFGIFVKTNPGTLDDWIVDHGLYDSNRNPYVQSIVKNFYLSWLGPFGYYRVVPNHDCPDSTEKTCFRTWWSDSKARKLLDYDLDHGNPPIMKISWTGGNSHFVLIGGYDKETRSYRAYDPGRYYNREKKFPPGLWELYDNRGLTYTPLRVDRFKYDSSMLGKPNLSELSARDYSPVEILIIDPQGRATGYDPVTGAKVEDIPYASYSEESISSLDSDDPEPEPTKELHIDMPIAGNYILKMTGTGSGPYTIVFRGIKEDGSVNLDTSITGTTYPGMVETYRVQYSTTGEAIISSTNQPPVANAGSDQTGEQSYEITLDGSGSYDPDGDPLKYTWSFVSKPTGSTASLSNPNAVNPTFTPDLPGTYVLQLVVSDYFTYSSPATVTITATPVKSQISVTPNFSTPLTTGTGTISFDVSNIGRVGVSNGIIDITLKDPDGIVVYTGSQTFSIAVGQSITVNIPVTIPSLKFGNYTLTYIQSDETRTGSPTTVYIPNFVITAFSFDKVSYKVRETANLTLNLVNTGKFNLDNVLVTVSVSDVGYSDTKNVNIGQGQTVPLQFAIQIPDTITAGQHNVNVSLTLPSGSSTIQSAKFTVQESSLIISYSGLTTLSPGDVIHLIIENTGGVDTTYVTEKLTITDNNGVVVYRGNIAGSIFSGERKTITDVQIPFQTANGLVYLYAVLKDTKTEKLSSLHNVLNIIGLEASLSTRTDKEVYLNTEAVTAISTLANSNFNIENGVLNIKVNRYKKPTGEQFSHFLPLKGWATFYYPSGVAVASDGSVYVADTGNNRIQRFDGNGGFITKWGSYCHTDTDWDGVPDQSCDGQFNGPHGIAVASDGTVYVADTYNHRIQKFNGNGNFIMRWGSQGSSDGQFRYPYGIAIAPDSTVYVADTLNSRIQKFDSNGNFITKWGSYGVGDGQFYYPQDIAVGPDSTVYVADTLNSRIQKFDSNGNFIMKWGTWGGGDGQFYAPWSIGVAPDGTVYVADTYCIKKFDNNGNFITKWPLYASQGIAIAPDGTVYIADTENNCIQKFDSNGNFIAKWGTWGGGDGQFKYPKGIAVSSDGTVYVADTSNNRIQKFDSNGNFITKWGSYGVGDGQFYYPDGIAVTPDGSVYVVDTYNHRIQKFNSNGNFITKWGSYGSGDGQFKYPKGIAVSSDGTVYVADTSNNRIQKFDSNGNFITKWGSYGVGDGQFYYPDGIAVTPDGSVYVADTWNHRVQKFDGNGNFVTKWGNYGIGNGEFMGPSGIAVAYDGSVYVADTYNHRIQKFDNNGNFIIKWGSYGSGNGQFYYPQEIAVGPNGTVYVADTYNHRIQRMLPVGGGAEILFETTLPINQPANTTQDYTTNIGTLNTTGKLYLEAELKNSLGQTIATSEYLFYIIEGNTLLLFSTDKKDYKPNETVTITGEVKNLASITASGLSLVLSQQSSVDSQNLYTATFDLPANGSYPFIVTTTATSEGVYTLTGKVTQGTSTLVELTDQYEVASPEVSVAVSAPEVVGNEPFNINVEFKNESKIDAAVEFTVHSSQFTDTQQITIPAGETKLIQYSQQIANTTTYTFAFTGDLNQTITKTVYCGLGASVAMNSLTFYPEGRVAIPVTITNTGRVDEALTVTYGLQPLAITESRSYYLPKGANITDTLYFDLTEGSYQLSAISYQPDVAVQTSFIVVKENNVTMTNVVGSQGMDRLIPVTVNLTNNGYNEINGSIQLTVINSQGKNVWRGEAQVLGLKSQTSMNYQINVDSTGITSGAYNTSIVLYSTSGQQLAANQAQIRILGPIFEITSMPVYPTFTVGREAVFAFNIKNTGTQEGKMNFNVTAMDVLNSSVTEIFQPGEEKPYTFNFTVPEDAEEGDYLADYTLTPVLSQGMSGQVKFHVAGINIDVTASLDKEAYRNGDTAILTMTISKLSEFEDGDYLAIIRYGAYHDMQSFMLSNQPATLTFSVPLTIITGENLFYSIHFNSGRTIYRNAISINEVQPDLIIEKLSSGQDAVTTYKLSAVVTNQGETASGPSAIALYDNESLIETKTVNALNPGESQEITFMWNVLGKAGEHTITAIVDPEDTVIEFSEENNTAQIDILIPDITLITETDKDIYKIRQKVNISSTITNLTSTKTYQNLILSTSAKDPSGNEVYQSSTLINTIEPLSSIEHTEIWNTSGLPVDGVYTITQTILSDSQPLTQTSKPITFEKAPDFTLRTDIDYQKIKQGEKATYTIYIESLNGWSSEITLNIEGLPLGTSVSFNPGNLIPPGEALTVIITTDATPTGTHTLNLIAEGIDEGEIVSHTLPLTLDVSGFELEALPSSATIKQLETATFDINLNSINGYEGEVNLNIDRVPFGIKAFFDNTQSQVPGNVKLTVLTSKYVRPGNYELIVTGDDGLVKHRLNLILNLLTNPEIAAGIITTEGPGPNNEAWVRLFNANIQLVLDFMAFGTKYGAYATSADIDGDGYDEIIVSQGPDPKNTTTLRAFKKDGTLLVEYTAFDTNYGVTLSSGDLDGDWVDELVVGMGPDPKNPATLKILKYNSSGFTEIMTQTVSDTTYGVNIAMGDMDGDGLPEIITAAGPGPNNPAIVKIWRYDGIGLTEIYSFTAFEGNYGVNITTGDIDGDSVAEIITGTGPDPKNSAVVRVYKPDETLIIELRPYDTQHNYGVAVAAGDLNGDGIDEIITGLGPGPQNKAWVKIFKADGTEISSFLAYPEDIEYGIKVFSGRTWE
jgi:DNA-binding beta-propeller fold protein YncE